MGPVLIYKDQERIDQEKTALNESIVFLQDFYNALKAIGLTVTLSEMKFLSQSVSHNKGWYPERLAKFVKDRLLDKAGAPAFNGVQFNRSLLEAHISMPDLSPLESILKAYNDSREHDINGNPLGIRENLIDFSGELFTKKAGADSALETEFSYYTKTESGAVLAGHLNLICAALNNFATVYPPGQYGNGWGLHYADGVPIPGITVREQTFIPDLNFIRQKEQFSLN